jgi:hypothetical protein
LYQISEGAEHLLAGNAHETTNNSVQSTASLSSDHIVDKQIAKDMVTRVYQTALGRAPTTTELSDGYQAIVTGGGTEAGIANNIVSPQWIVWPYLSNPSLFEQAYGALSNSALVARLFVNSLGRNPTATESTDWVTMLDNNSISRGDMIYAFAESAEHLAFIGASAGQAVTASNQTLSYGENIITRISGGGNTINAGRGDVLTVGGNGASGACNVVNMSYGSVSLQGNSRMVVSGSRNVITVASGCNVGVNGDDNILSANSDSISINGGAGNIVNGSSNTLTEPRRDRRRPFRLSHAAMAGSSSCA